MSYDRCCRLCLQLGDGGIDVSAPQTEIIVDIQTFFGLEIKQTDRCSKKICRRCFAKVRSFAVFRNSVLRNQRTIEEYVSLQEKLKEIKVEDSDGDGDIQFVSEERLKVETIEEPIEETTIIAEVPVRTKNVAMKRTSTPPASALPKTKKAKVVLEKLTEEEMHRLIKGGKPRPPTISVNKPKPIGPKRRKGTNTPEHELTIGLEAIIRTTLTNNNTNEYLVSGNTAVNSSSTDKDVPSTSGGNNIALQDSQTSLKATADTTLEQTKLSSTTTTTPKAKNLNNKSSKPEPISKETQLHPATSTTTHSKPVVEQTKPASTTPKAKSLNNASSKPVPKTKETCSKTMLETKQTQLHPATSTANQTTPHHQVGNVQTTEHNYVLPVRTQSSTAPQFAKTTNCIYGTPVMSNSKPLKGVKLVKTKPAVTNPKGAASTYPPASTSTGPTNSPSKASIRVTQPQHSTPVQFTVAQNPTLLKLPSSTRLSLVQNPSNPKLQAALKDLLKAGPSNPPAPSLATITEENRSAECIAGSHATPPQRVNVLSLNTMNPPLVTLSKFSSTSMERSQNVVNTPPPQHNRVKVLTVNEVNQTVFKSTEPNQSPSLQPAPQSLMPLTEQYTPPFSIRLLRFRNMVQIKIHDKNQTDVHFMKLNSAERNAVKISLMQPCSVTQIRKAMQTCTPDAYSQALLTCLGLENYFANM